MDQIKNDEHLFQLPLSGSRAEGGRAFGTYRLPLFQLPLSGSQGDAKTNTGYTPENALSTPSLGITRVVV